MNATAVILNLFQDPSKLAVAQTRDAMDSRLRGNDEKEAQA